MPVAEARRDSLYPLSELSGGDPSFGTVYDLVSPAGPVDLINSAKSDTESDRTRASLAVAPLARAVGAVMVVGAGGTGPAGLMMALLSRILGLAGDGGRRGEGKLTAAEGVNIGDALGEY